VVTPEEKAWLHEFRLLVMEASRRAATRIAAIERLAQQSSELAHMESLLGLRLEVDKLRFTPCLPADWPGFTMHYRYRETVYHIAVQSAPAGEGGTLVTVDGAGQPDNATPLVDDHQEHFVKLNLPVASSQTQP